MSYKHKFLSISNRIINRLLFCDIFNNLHSIEAKSLVDLFDFSVSDIESTQQLHELNTKNIDINRIIWFIPGINNPFWGGIHTILNFASFYKERYSVDNYFVITGNFDESTIRDSISLAFPILKEEEIVIAQSEKEIANLKAADISICTQWKTAFFSLKFNKVKRKFYFIQDYEPLFYPAGSISALVEETYRFGFYGITNTISLKNIYDSYYGGHSVSFTPSIDNKIFYPSKNRINRNKKLVFFYARPDHPRNGFELGISALEKLKQKMGDQVRIVTAGATWTPEDFGIEGILENLGLLKYEETAELYRQCDAGLVMMFTRHPSYLPLELMACGCPVVTNYNPATTWLLHDKENCLLTRASASCIADALHKCFIDNDLRNHLVQNGLTTAQNHANWREEMERVFEYMTRGCSR